MGKTIQVYGFPHMVSAEEVAALLEGHTGHGTVYALEVKQPKKEGSRTCAEVQFTTSESAEDIISLAKSRDLWYGSSYLKAREKLNDLVRKPKTFVNSMESVGLHFGCQVSADKFAVLWKKADVSVRFGFGFRKFYFFFPHNGNKYKLELFYENIWQIELHCPRGLNSKFLVIQLYGAPRIYEKCEESNFSYFKEVRDDQWVRTTDFTSSFSIGQSSHCCLELPCNVKLPNFRENFPYYKESESQFTLEPASSFAKKLDLVPIVGLPDGIELPYDIVFKICSLVQNGCIPGPVLDASFFRLVDPRRGIDIAYIEHALEKLYHSKDCCYEPARWLKEQYLMHLKSGKHPRSPAIALDDGLVYVRRVQVTPCKVYFCGPEVNVSNRVLRHYSEDIDNFLRISFVDEELGKLYSSDLLPRTATAGQETSIHKRILSVLRNGIVIGNKKFDFLAFSSSQLCDNSAWMFASRPGLNAADIRAWMGDFHQIKNVAKYAARLGQSFGSSKESLSVPPHEVEIIPDVTVTTDGTEYIFSDGIGKISDDFARRVAEKCRFKTTPSAFQIRYGGYKGVVAVDPTSSKKLSFRNSRTCLASIEQEIHGVQYGILDVLARYDMSGAETIFREGKIESGGGGYVQQDDLELNKPFVVLTDKDGSIALSATEEAEEEEENEEQGERLQRKKSKQSIGGSTQGAPISILPLHQVPLSPPSSLQETGFERVEELEDEVLLSFPPKEASFAKTSYKKVVADNDDLQKLNPAEANDNQLSEVPPALPPLGLIEMARGSSNLK
ncbi:hypothetical protein LguiB_026333 [Lonicera macranthoides]